MSHLKSVFERIATNVFEAKNLEVVKKSSIDFIKETEINEVDKNTIINNINEVKTLIRLQNYICNSLLKYEGLSLNK